MEDHLLPGEEEDLVGEGGGPEVDQGIISQYMRTMMEAMSRILGMPGVIGEVEVEFTISVDVGGEVTMVLRWIMNMMLEATIKNSPEVNSLPKRSHKKRLQLLEEHN